MVLRISCARYPTRRLFFEFITRFGILAPEVLAGRYVLCSLPQKCTAKRQMSVWFIVLFYEFNLFYVCTPSWLVILFDFSTAMMRKLRVKRYWKRKGSRGTSYTFN